MKLPMAMNLSQIAAVIGGEVQGSADITVETVATSPLSASENDLAFIFDKQLLKHIDKCKAKAIIVPSGTVVDRPAIFVSRPTFAIYKMLSALNIKRHYPAQGIHPTAIIDANCEIAPDCAIGPYVVIGPKTKVGSQTVIMANTTIGAEVTIGANCLIHPGCMIADNVQIGNKVILQQGASVGSDGFGYVTERPSNMELRMKGINELSEDPNPLLKIPQIGTVIIEDEVEIGSNATIDRATIGATKIGRGTKIDNLVMVAHNCEIGKEVILVSQVGIAGSCHIGDRAIIAGQAGLVDHTKIGKDAIIQGQAGVMRNVEDGEVQTGSPAIPAKEFMKSAALYRKLPAIVEQLRAAGNKITELQTQISELKQESQLQLHKAGK